VADASVAFGDGAAAHSARVNAVKGLAGFSVLGVGDDFCLWPIAAQFDAAEDKRNSFDLDRSDAMM
jgi:hypothetical protein